MTITFYILLGYLNLTKQYEKFVWKSLEHKMNVFFGIYSVLWCLIIIMTLFTFFVFKPLFVIFALLMIWLIAEFITGHAILIRNKHKEILKNEILGDNLGEDDIIENLNKKGS